MGRWEGRHLFWEASAWRGAGYERGEGAAWGLAVLLGWELGKPWEAAERLKRREVQTSRQ